MIDLRLIMDDPDTDYDALLKIAGTCLQPLDRSPARREGEGPQSKIYISDINTKFAEELKGFDLAFIAAPRALYEGFFDELAGLDCGIPVVILNLNSDPEYLKKQFSHIERLVITGSHPLDRTRIDKLVGKWEMERELESTRKVIRPPAFNDRPRTRLYVVPDRPAAPVLKFPPREPQPSKQS